MPPEAYFTLALTAGVLITLIATRIGPDVVLMLALSILVISGILSPEQALVGFANPGVITIAVLYIVAAGLKETGAIQYMTGRLLGQPGTTRQAQACLIMPTSVLSAFMNNTAVVAMLIPAVQDWAQRIGIPASKLLLPLSCTSTNLVDGLLAERKIE